MKAEKFVSGAASLSVFAMGLFLYLFITRNAPGLTTPLVLTAMALVYGIVYAVAARALSTSLKQTEKAGACSPGAWLLRTLILILFLLLIMLFLDSAVTDYYQPVSLYDDVIAAVAAWWVLLILAGIAMMVTRVRNRIGPLFIMALLAAWTIISWPLAASLYWINQPGPGDSVAFHRHVFEGGVDGYAIYRIPGMALIPAGSNLASGAVLAKDRLVAIAEARRDGAPDQGVIDLVLKYSDDGGRSWSEQAVICRNEQDGRRGKCGNPAPVFDSKTGTLWLGYNLSGTMAESRWHSGHIMQSGDGGLTWQAPLLVSDDNFIFGPGKGLQKARAPHAGRLLLPGYADGHAQVMYSDDNGASWNRGGSLPGSDETDIAELTDGSLYLNTRHRAPIARPPEPNGRQFSRSGDGGASWQPTEIDTTLTTPVCQASVLSTGEGRLLFSNPAHHRSRVRMTLRHSSDGGTSWDEPMPVYPGPSGYSVLAQGSDGSVYLLYENGNMSYSERISLAVIELPST